MDVLTKQQEEMIVMIIQGHAITDIAKTIGVARQTVYDWMGKDYIKDEVDKQRRMLVHQGHNLIMKDVTTYIANIQKLAKDHSDKRTCLAANQYLLNRIYGNPTVSMDTGDNGDKDGGMSSTELDNELKKFKKLKAVK